MAKTTWCKVGEHDQCKGTVLMGAPEPISIEKCKCPCHKEKKNG